MVLQLVRAAVDESLVGAAEDVDARSRAHVKFNLLKWMRDALPSSEAIESALAEVVSEHPDFRQSEHPDWGCGREARRVWLRRARFLRKQ